MLLIKIPFSAGGLGKTKGVELAPDAIIEQMQELFLNESGIKPEFKIEDVKINQSNIDESFKEIENKVKTLDEKAILLGGDHSITYPAFKAFAEKNPGAGLVVFDAHPDCQSKGFVTHEDFLRTLVDKGILDKNKVILIGLRNWHGDEREWLELNKIRFFSMKQVFEMGVKELCDTVMETIRQWPSAYLSIDIDVADPAFAPGTGYNEPGGLTSRQLIYFLQRLKLLKNLKIADIVEINPKKDIANLTTKLGAKILNEIFTV